MNDNFDGEMFRTREVSYLVSNYLRRANVNRWSMALAGLPHVCCFPACAWVRTFDQMLSGMILQFSRKREQRR
jgi:hypothetical protein